MSVKKLLEIHDGRFQVLIPNFNKRVKEKPGVITTSLDSEVRFIRHVRNKGQWQELSVSVCPTRTKLVYFTRPYRSIENQDHLQWILKFGSLLNE